MPDPMYHCHDCKINFPVRGFISRDLKKTGHKAHCPRCNGQSTENARDMSRPTTTARSFPSADMDTPPTEAQLGFIQGLNGRPGSVKTRKEASDYIARLKKLKEAG